MLNLYIVFVVLKFFSWDRERALLKMGARRALIKMGARALLNVEGQPNLSNLVITVPRTFYRECLLNDYVIYLRTYEK